MKKIVLGLSLLTFFLMLIFMNSVELGLCNIEDYSCRLYIDRFEKIFYLVIPVLFFSLLTYKLPVHYFTRWWNFAKYSIPIILTLSSAIYFELHHNETSQMQDMFNAPILLSLYSIFILGSLVQIYKARLASAGLQGKK
jgi:hypothetical protein